MQKTSGREAAAFLSVAAVAVFFRFYELSLIPPVKGLVSSGWMSRGLSALFGVLTVIGLYILVRELYDWRMAALAGFMAAISFWAVMFSRLAEPIVVIPLLLVWSFYFLWRGLKRSTLVDYFWAGVFAGAGFYFSALSWFVPLIVLFLFLNYWSYIKKDFGHDRYEHTRNRFLAGFSLFVLAAFFTALPLGWRYLSSGGFSAAASIFTFVSWPNFFASAGKTLAMFNFRGDMNQTHGIAEAALIGWPIGIFFVIGFFKELWHWLRRKHGHFSPSHTFLFVWFFAMLAPGFLSANAPDYLLTFGAMPVAAIFTARGIWWVFEALGAWHDVNYPLKQYHERKEASAFAIWALIVLLAALGSYGYYRYFQNWAQSPATTAAFSIKK